MTEAVDILHAGETTTADSMRFSYSRPEQRWLRRSIIRGIEQISGQPYLERLYRGWTANPAYKNHITMPSPLSSGTAFLAVNGWLTAFGEEGGWQYMDALHENISQYGHSGSAPCRQAAAGETVIGISYSTPGVKAINDGAPIKIILPEEGLGWEIEATAIIKGAKNMDDARRLADWVSSREAAQISSKFLPITAYDDISELPENYPEGEKEKLLKMDFASLAANREAVMAEWQKRYGTKVPPKQ